MMASGRSFQMAGRIYQPLQLEPFEDGGRLLILSWPA
jgi:hypothetical protein